MATHTRLRVGAVALVFLLMALLGGANLCAVAQDPGARPLSTGALACAEFWLNRYQTLIGALVAIGAALLAYNGVRLQVISAENQVKVGRRQSAIALLETMNERTTDVRAMRSEIIALYKRLSAASGNKKSAIASIAKMSTLIDDPVGLRNEYADRFERIMRSHSILIEASEANFNQARAYLGKALISTTTKSQIEDFISHARHCHATHVIAQQIFSEVIGVFDEKTDKLRASVIEDKLAEAESIAVIEVDNEHAGYRAAMEAAQSMAEMIDLALQDAEGRQI